GMEQPIVGADRVRERGALRAEAAEVRRLLGVRADRDLRARAVVGADDEPAADPAIRTGRPDRAHTSTSTRPSSTRTANVAVQPSSAPVALPVRRSMTQSCSGHVTRSPWTMPWDNGPPRCGQRSLSAKTSPADVRKIAIDR